MITIRTLPFARNPQERLEFETSLANQCSEKGCYELIGENDTPCAESAVVVDMPDDCLVLGNSWDKYIRYRVDHPEWRKYEGIDQMGIARLEMDFLKKVFGLESRNGSGIFLGLKMSLTTR